MLPTKTELVQEFMKGRNCAMCTLGRYAEREGYDIEETDRFTRCFGGGMELGQTCGAVAGGLMALGMAASDPAEAREMGDALRSRFLEKHGTSMCRELIGYDLSQPGQLEAARASGVLFELCPEFVRTAMEILDELIGD